MLRSLGISDYRSLYIAFMFVVVFVPFHTFAASSYSGALRIVKMVRVKAGPHLQVQKIGVHSIAKR
jgi:hypothetical protein